MRTLGRALGFLLAICMLIAFGSFAVIAALWAVRLMAEMLPK